MGIARTSALAAAIAALAAAAAPRSTHARTANPNASPPPRAAPPVADSQLKEKPPPPTIEVRDDVGVGEHFPSLVPGGGLSRLPERRDSSSPESGAVQATASEESEWETIAPPPPP